MMCRPIFLVGFMGSGKTTWGKKLAKALDRPFVDLDAVLVSRIGMSIPAYFSEFGEESFRKLEREALREQVDQRAVVSTGGGTPCYFDNMDWILAHGTALYLKHSVKSLWNRLNASDVNKRPALKGFTGDQLLTFISEKLQERTPYYQRAHLVVDQVNTSLDQLVEICQNHS